MIPVLVWVFWMATESPGVHDVVALDHALVAQNVISGKGMTSPVITPLHLTLGGELDNAGPIFAKPFYVLWESLLFAVRYPSSSLASLASGIPWFLTSWLVFMLASRMHSSETGWLCFFVFILNPMILDLSTSGRPETMGMFLICALAAIISTSPPDRSALGLPLLHCLASGLAVGLLALCVPYVALGLILILSVYWYRWPARASMENPLQIDEFEMNQFTIYRAWFTQRFCIRAVGIFVLGLLLPVAFVFIVQLIMSGPAPLSMDRYLMTIDAASSPGWSFWRTYDSLNPYWLVWVSTHLGIVFAKFLGGMAYGLTALFEIFHPAVIALYIFALFLPEYGEKRGYRWLLPVLVVAQIIVMSVFYWDKQVLLIWSPLFIVISVGVFSEFLDERRIKRSDEVKYQNVNTRLRHDFIIYYGPMILLLALTAGLFFLRLADGKRPQKLYASAALEKLTEHQDTYHTIATPSPWLVSWFSGSRAIWLPETAKGMQQLEQKFGNDIQVVYLPRTRAEILHDKVPSWWFFLLQREDKLPSYQPADFGAVGEAVYIKPAGAAK